MQIKNPVFQNIRLSRKITMVKTADLTVVQKTLIDTLHKEVKPQKVIAARSGCLQRAVFLCFGCVSDNIPLGECHLRPAWSPEDRIMECAVYHSWVFPHTWDNGGHGQDAMLYYLNRQAAQGQKAKARMPDRNTSKATQTAIQATASQHFPHQCKILPVKQMNCSCRLQKTSWLGTAAFYWSQTCLHQLILDMTIKLVGLIVHQHDRTKGWRTCACI